MTPLTGFDVVFQSAQTAETGIDQRSWNHLLNLTVGAVCVYHALVETAVKALKGSNIPVAAVSTGFPHGLSPLPRRIEEIRDSVSAGALEIDIVITRAHVFSGNWEALYQEIKSFREACGDSHLKTILGTGELGSLRNVAKASLVCMMAGADFIKTSTGRSLRSDPASQSGDAAYDPGLSSENRT